MHADKNGFAQVPVLEQTYITYERKDHAVKHEDCGERLSWMMANDTVVHRYEILRV